MLKLLSSTRTGLLLFRTGILFQAACYSQAQGLFISFQSNLMLFFTSKSTLISGCSSFHLQSVQAFYYFRAGLLSSKQFNVFYIKVSFYYLKAFRLAFQSKIFIISKHSGFLIFKHSGFLFQSIVRSPSSICNFLSRIMQFYYCRFCYTAGFYYYSFMHEVLYRHVLELWLRRSAYEGRGLLYIHIRRIGYDQLSTQLINLQYE